MTVRTLPTVSAGAVYAWSGSAWVLVTGSTVTNTQYTAVRFDLLTASRPVHATSAVLRGRLVSDSSGGTWNARAVLAPCNLATPDPSWRNAAAQGTHATNTQGVLIGTTDVTTGTATAPKANAAAALNDALDSASWPSTGSYLWVVFTTTSVTAGFTPDRFTLALTVQDGLSIDWTSSKTARTVSFTAQAAPSEGATLTGYSWTFGDGATATSPTPSHTYAADGTYTVTLTVTDSSGASRTTTKSVVVDQYPTVTVAATPGTGQASLNATATVSIVHAAGASTVSTVVDWGDGASSTDAPWTHTYGAPGGYAVTATVTDSRGATGVGTTSVAVTMPTTAVIVAHTVGLDVTLNGTGSVAAVGRTLTGYAWSFGDGATATGESVAHTYASGGTYTVTLTVTDSSGAQASSSLTVTPARIALAALSDPVWVEAVGSAVRHESLMVDVIDQAGTVVATYGGPDSPSLGLRVQSVAATRDQGRSVALDVSGALVPRTSDHPLSVWSGNRIRVWWMLRVNDVAWQRYPLATVHPDMPDVTGQDTIVTASLRCVDTVQLIRDSSGWTTDIPSVDGLTATQAIEAVLRWAIPTATLRVTHTPDPLPAGYQIGSPSSSPQADLEKLLSAVGAVMYCDPWGTVIVEPKRSGGSAKAAFAHGPGSRMYGLRRVTRAEDLCNEVLVYTTASTVVPPVHAVASLDDPRSPLSTTRRRYWRRVIASDVATTAQQCQEIADRALADGARIAEEVSVDHRVIPDLEVGDTVSISHPLSGPDGTGTVTGWSISWDDSGISRQSTTIETEAVTLT